MVSRRGFAVTLGLGVLSRPLTARAQRAATVTRVGFLWPGSRLPDPEWPWQFLPELRTRGWVEGQNIAIDWRFAEGSADRLNEFATDLVRLRVDAICAVSSASVQAAGNATKTIPIIAIDLETDPVSKGLAVSLARPRGNVTGLFLDVPELTGKWLQLLAEMVPRLSRVAVLWDAALDRTPLRATDVLAQSQGMQLQILEVRGPSDFNAAFQAATRRRAGALMVMQSPDLDVHQKLIVELAAASRLPTIAMFERFVEAGGLAAYGVNLAELYRVGARFIDKILRGAKPADLPMERPTRFDFVVNLRTAKALGLTIPQSVLMRADRVIR